MVESDRAFEARDIKDEESHRLASVYYGYANTVTEEHVFATM